MLAKEIDQPLFKRLQKLDKPILRLDSKKANALAKGGNHQGFLASGQDPEFVTMDSVRDASRLIVLDRVTDVGNIGAIMRTAYCFGYDAIVLGGMKTLSWGGVVRSSSGAALDLPVALSSSLLDLANELKQAGFWLIGADAKSSGGAAMIRSERHALFMGNEGEGLLGRLMTKMDHIESIAMMRAFDSLNVSVSAGIIMDRVVHGRDCQ